MISIFSHPVNVIYQAPILSKANVFYLISSILTFVPPLLIAFRSQGFWHSHETYREQPEVHFRHELLLQLETSEIGSPLVWSTNRKFNLMMQNKVRIPLVKTKEEDWNNDGILDGLELKIEMPVKPEEQVIGVNLFLFFDVKLHKFSSVHLQGMGHVNYGNGIPGSGLDLSGDLKLVQKQPIAHKGRDNRYNEPILDTTDASVLAFDFAHILKNYQQRNLTTRLENEYFLWKRGPNRLHPFTVTIKIHYPEQQLIYKVGFWQLLKWAWVQYVSILVIFVVLLRKIKTFVFSNHVLPCKAEIQMPVNFKH